MRRVGSLREAVEGPESPPRPLIRLVAAGATLLAVGAAAYLIFTGGGGYTVSGRFLSSSQLVKGNEVRMGGADVGSVTGLEIAPDGRARVTMSIDDEHAPLPRGVRAVIRLGSLSGIANRYVDLQLPDGERRGTIPDGGEIAPTETQAATDFDHLFETLDPETRRDLQRFFKGSAKMFRGRGAEARRGYRYLNPALSRSRRLFAELGADRRLLESFVVDSAGLVTTLADRRAELAALIGNLRTTTRAAGADREALAEAIGRFPGFMREANTTFANLRFALDEVDPLVDASKPVARRLQRLLPQLRGLAADAEPTVRDLSRTVRRGGSANDLIDLARSFPPLADIAVDPGQRNGERRVGAFPATSRALVEAAPLIAQGRPYTPDLVGWFDDFSHSGAYDALGGFSRSQTYFNLFSISAGGVPTVLELQERASNFLGVARTGQFKRCPGHAEVPAPDGSNVWSEEEQERLDCRESDRATGSTTP